MELLSCSAGGPILDRRILIEVSSNERPDRRIFHWFVHSSPAFGVRRKNHEIVAPHPLKDNNGIRARLGRARIPAKRSSNRLGAIIIEHKIRVPSSPVEPLF